MKTKRSVVGAFLGPGFAGLVLTTAIPAFAQDNSIGTTGQQGAPGQQGQQSHWQCAPSSCASRSQ
jgi:hypothetical protein